MITKTCPHCKHVQAVHTGNVWQDVKGKFTVCENCSSHYDIELEITPKLTGGKSE